MKLIRFGEAGKEKTGIIINNKRYDTSNNPIILIAMLATFFVKTKLF